VLREKPKKTILADLFARPATNKFKKFEDMKEIPRYDNMPQNQSNINIFAVLHGQGFFRFV